MRYIPMTTTVRHACLMGISSVDELFADIPDLCAAGDLNLPPALLRRSWSAI